MMGVGFEKSEGPSIAETRSFMVSGRISMILESLNSSLSGKFNGLLSNTIGWELSEFRTSQVTGLCGEMLESKSDSSGNLLAPSLRLCHLIPVARTVGRNSSNFEILWISR